MSDPGFTLYSDNFLAGTMFFTDEQVGKYMRAMCAQHVKGHLTFDQLNVFAKNDSEVIAKFVIDENGLYYNVRLDKEIKKRASFSESQKSKANKRWSESTPALPGDVPGHCRGNAIIKSKSKIKINNIKTPEKKEGVQGEKGTTCRREGKTVPAQLHRSYVKLAPGEYERMIADWGKEFADAAIADYDENFPNSPAKKKHTDHNRAIRYYVRKKYICADKTPQPPQKAAPKVSPEKEAEELGTPEERAALVRQHLPPSVRSGTGPERIGDIVAGMRSGP